MTELKTQFDQATMTVIFNRPEAHNAMTFEMYEALHAACELVDADPSIRVMVLRGAGGKAFVAGTDIPQLEQFTTEQSGLEYEQLVERVISRLEQVRVPVIAAVNGVAAGAGIVLAIAADLCICTSDSRFGAPVARTLGNCLSVRNCARLERVIGVRHAKAVLFSAEMLPAYEALHVGLVTDVTEPHEFDARLHKLTQQLAQNAPLSLYAFKEAYQLLAKTTPPEDEVEIIDLCYSSADFREGIRAFQEKRRPVWSGK
jgi:enoyl-CoA hydratase/carnithine racemase